MKRRLIFGLMRLAGALTLAVAARAESDFTATMTAEEAAATGLAKLTPAELARLKAVVERYKSGEMAQVQVQAEAKVTAVTQEAEQKVALAEAKVREAETKASVADAAEPKKGPGWLKALITLKKTGDKPDEAEALESRLAGTLTGFSGKRQFALANGQVWQMTDVDGYSGPALDQPPVTIRPGAFGTYWLKIKDAGVRFRVKPLKLE